MHVSTQTPPVQVPEQQSPAVLQNEPSGRHCPQLSPQTVDTSSTHVASHSDLQQNGSMAQIAPTQGSHEAARGAGSTSHLSWVQPGAPHVPPVQDPEQQSAANSQTTPSGRHAFAQRPVSSQFALQHSWLELQRSPLGVQEPPHAPLSQMPVQQSPAPLQSAPFGRQPVQNPSEHCPEQHCGSDEQSSPLGVQADAHAPPTQLPEQHSGAVPQAEPSGEHSAMQTPPAQSSVQHCSFWLQAAPTSKHESAHRPEGSHTFVQQSDAIAHASPA